jgi:hypothetical protein
VQFRASIFFTIAILSSFLCSLVPSLSDELRVESVPNFMTPVGLDSFRMAMKDTEHRDRTKLAADAISQTFAGTERSNVTFLSATQISDAGPTAALSDQAYQLPEADVVTVQDVHVAQIRASKSRSIRLSRKSKPVVRMASLPVTDEPMLAEPAPQPPSEIDSRGARPVTASMQPLLSNCRQMTPACLANKAWCGC